MDNKYCIVPTLSALYALQNHEEGECVFCEEDNKIYTWQENDGWGAVDLKNEGLSLNLYDLNKSIVNQLPPLQRQDIAVRMDVIHKLNLIVRMYQDPKDFDLVGCIFRFYPRRMVLASNKINKFIFLF